MICGCETGGDCTKTTVCANQLIVDALNERIEALEDFVNIVRQSDSISPVDFIAALENLDD